MLTYSTGIDANDTTFQATFPYVQTPWSGTGKCSGAPVIYNQPGLLLPTSIDKSLGFSPLKVFPMPATDMLNVSFTTQTAGEIQVKVFTLSGQQVIQKTASLPTGQNRLALPVSELTDGIYFIKMTRGDRLVGSAKFIKQ